MRKRYRKNLSWLELGKRIMKLDGLHPVLRRKAEAAIKRRLKWQAYRMTEVDKYGNRKAAGQWLWIPKARIIGHLELPESGTFMGDEKYEIQWTRAHPLARTLKEVWFQHQWGQESYERAMRRRDPEYMPVQPPYKHWLEAREVAEREGRTIPPFDKWREQLDEEWHWRWYMRGGGRRSNPAGRSWANPKARRFASRLAASLRRLHSSLLQLMRQVRRDAILGWDTILDRTEAAIMRCCPGMFKRELGRINGLRRSYEGYKMPSFTAIEPALDAIARAERALGMRRR